MVDGINGLVPGLSLIWCMFLLVYAPPHIFPILLLLMACTFITLIFNFMGKLFLGNSGSYALGTAISILTIYVYNMTAGDLRADVVVVWFIVPVLDCLRLMVVRARQGRSPLSPDTNHLHHRLQRLMPRRWVVITIWMMVAIPGAVAMAVPSLALVAVLAAAGVYAGFLVWGSNAPVGGSDATPEGPRPDRLGFKAGL